MGIPVETASVVLLWDITMYILTGKWSILPLESLASTTYGFFFLLTVYDCPIVTSTIQWVLKNFWVFLKRLGTQKLIKWIVIVRSILDYGFLCSNIYLLGWIFSPVVFRDSERHRGRVRNWQRYRAMEKWRQRETKTVSLSVSLTLSLSVYINLALKLLGENFT
jgi:hypothetical protein